MTANAVVDVVSIDNLPLVQRVTGSINVYTHGAQLVSGTVAVTSANVYTSGPQAVSGTVFVTSTGSLPVTGSVSVVGPVMVSVANAALGVYDPGVQAMSGSVSTYTQGAQAVTGSVSVFTQGPQFVSGTVSVTGSVIVYTSSPQAISGSVEVYTQGPQNVSGSVSVYTQGAQLVSGTVIITSTGSLAVTGSVAIVGRPLCTYDTATQGVSGSVSAYTQGAQLVSGTINLGNWPPILAVSGSQLTGSTFNGYPVVVGGATTTGTTRALLVDNSGVLFVTGTSNLTDSTGANVSVGTVRSGSTATGFPLQVAGVDTSNQSGTGSIVRNVLVDSRGRVITAPAGTLSTLNGFVFGSLSTTLGTLQKLEATTYTEMTGSAQRSIVSTSASDAAAGVGARTIKIVYYKNDFSGPFTDTVTLNGTSIVNTAATNICFVERMEVVTAGSNNTNVGTISLRSTTGGVATIIGSIGVGTVVAASGDGRTLWAHHYVPNGITCYVTVLTTGHNNNTSQGSGGLFFVKAAASGSNQTEVQVTDYVHQYGQASSTSRTYNTPVKITGPARLLGYVLPDSALTVVYHLSFDFYEQ